MVVLILIKYQADPVLRMLAVRRGSILLLLRVLTVFRRSVLQILHGLQSILLGFVRAPMLRVLPVLALNIWAETASFTTNGTLAVNTLILE